MSISADNYAVVKQVLTKHSTIDQIYTSITELHNDGLYPDEIADIYTSIKKYHELDEAKMLQDIESLRQTKFDLDIPQFIESDLLETMDNLCGGLDHIKTEYDKVTKIYSITLNTGKKYTLSFKVLEQPADNKENLTEELSRAT